MKIQGEQIFLKDLLDDPKIMQTATDDPEGERRPDGLAGEGEVSRRFRDDPADTSESGNFSAEETHRQNEGKSRTSIVFSNFEQALKVVGAFGSYQIGFILCVQLSLILWCGNFVFMAYATYEPTVVCSTTGNLSLNGTGLSFNLSLPATNVTLNHDKPKEFCDIYSAGGCESVSWTAPFYTVVEEWELICDKDWIPQMFNSVQMAGTVLATAFTGVSADFFGRKFVFYLTFALFLISSVGCTLVTTPILFATSRFFVGGFLSASITSNFVWGMEITDQKHNVIVNCGMLWHFAYIFTALIGYLTAKWTTYLLVVNGIGAPLLILYSFYYESPRWLIQKGQLERAARLLTKMADTNRPHQKVEISVENLTGLGGGSTGGRGSTKSPPWHTLLTHKTLRTFTGVISLLFCSASASATAYIFQVSLLPGSPFVKFAIYGALRSWIPFVIYYSDKKFKRFGRRLMLLVPMFVVFLCYFVTTVAAMIGNYPTLFFVGTLSGAVVCNCLWVALGQYTIELFPTVVRNTAVSITTLCDPFVGMIMPQLIYLERHWRALPFFFVSFFTGISVIVAYYILPETKGKPLPDTVADMDSKRYAYQEWKQGGAGLASWKQNLKSTCCCEEEESLMGNMDHTGIEDMDDVVFDINSRTDTESVGDLSLR